MNRSFFQTAEKLNNEHRRQRRWHKVITVMAAVVVFCTTYALILPAITWERSLLCDMKEHTHTAACYAEVELVPDQQELMCSESEHTHSDSCYEDVPTYVCGLADDTSHQHGEDCVQVEHVLVCSQREHSHNDACYRSASTVTEQQLICDKPEHIHTDACFDAPPSSDSGYYCGHVSHTHNEYFKWDNEKHVLVVYNTTGYALPETGGSGLIPVYASGILLMVGALVYGYSTRRKRERRPSN